MFIDGQNVLKEWGTRDKENRKRTLRKTSDIEERWTEKRCMERDRGNGPSLCAINTKSSFDRYRSPYDLPMLQGGRSLRRRQTRQSARRKRSQRLTRARSRSATDPLPPGLSPILFPAHL
ncbi:unnamed protein product [Leptidea sinapis]|uniref:Uncharacterized protein n=1 Tax=Leptidea sinapis TaxID=189913 RepID=A0A5E4QB79_9NEOP|nr:unnamed protein product [Leptidea sinapis]